MKIKILLTGFLGIDGIGFFEYEETEAVTPEDALEIAWERFNVGEDEIAQAYRAKRLRSLSVGDMIEIDGRTWLCEPIGWREISNAS